MGLNGFGVILCSMLHTLAELCMSSVPWANEREKQGEEQQGGLCRLTPLPTDTPAPLQPSACTASGAPRRGRIVYQALLYIK